MRISIRAGRHRFVLILPVWLVLNRHAVRIALRAAGKHGADGVTELSAAQTERLIDEIRRIRRTRGRWDLVDVWTADGDAVKIEL